MAGSVAMEEVTCSGRERIRDPARIAALRATELLDSPPEVAFDRLAQIAARLLAAPIALVSLVDADRQFFKSAVGLAEPWASLRQTPLSHSFCQDLVLSHQPLVVGDAAAHPNFRENLAIPDLGVAAYLGVPLTTPEGHVLGGLCVIDHRPREWTRADVETLRVLADAVMGEIALRTLTRELGRRVRERSRQLEEAAERIREEQRFAQAIAQTAPVAIYAVEAASGASIFANPRAREILGFGAEEWARLRGEGLHRIVHPDDLARVHAHLRAVADAPDGQIEEIEWRARSRTGEWRWILSRDTPYRLAQPESGPLVVGAAIDVTEQKLAAAGAREAERRQRLRADLAAALSAAGPDRPIDTMLQEFAEIVEGRLPAALVRIWLLDEADGVLLLRASAGLHRGLGGMHARVPVGQLKIGRIALDRAAHVTNSVIGDPLVHDQEWAKRNGLVAFAGFPLLLAGRTLGVFALFSRSPLAPPLVESLVANAALLAQAVARKLAEGDLQAARAELEQRVAERTESLRSSVRSMEELLYAITHDLRAPNRTIRGYAELVAVTGAGRLDPDSLRYLQRIVDAATRNDALIRDILELGRLSHAEVPLGTIDLAEAMRVALETIDDLARAANATIRTDTTWPAVVGNGALVQQILVNLLTNALKYTRGDESPRVEVGASRAGDRVVLHVRDEGPGIPEEQQARVFEPFIRLPEAARVPGTGMGLALVRKAAERMNARIRVDSTPGHGSCFSLDLPSAL